MKHGCTQEIVREISTDLSHYNRIKVKLLSRVRLCANPQRASHQAPPSLDSPGRNTGVGCHFLLQCMKVKSEREIAQSCPTLSDPTDCSLLGSSIHGIFQARVLERVAIAFSVEACDLCIFHTVSEQYSLYHRGDQFFYS